MEEFSVRVSDESNDFPLLENAIHGFLQSPLIM